MNGVLIWAVLGIALYLLFFRKAGLGCCGGHSHGGPPRNGEFRELNEFNEYYQNITADIIDLDESQYKVVTRK